jgi:hypothetical protein
LEHVPVPGDEFDLSVGELELLFVRAIDEREELEFVL